MAGETDVGMIRYGLEEMHVSVFHRTVALSALYCLYDNSSYHPEISQKNFCLFSPVPQSLGQAN